MKRRRGRECEKERELKGIEIERGERDNRYRDRERRERAGGRGR